VGGSVDNTSNALNNFMRFAQKRKKKRAAPGKPGKRTAKGNSLRLVGKKDGNAAMKDVLTRFFAAAESRKEARGRQGERQEEGDSEE
jgi:hypothetical protein